MTGTKPDSGLVPGVTLLDGGTGSELRRRGVGLTALAWSAAAVADHAALLTRIHADYIAAGADVITAATFGATPYLLEAAGLGGRFEAVNRTALACASRARRAAEAAGSAHAADPGGPVGTGRPIRIAASLGCYPPGGDRERFPGARAELAAYRACTEMFSAAGVDLILVEMMQETHHAALVCRAAAESGLPFWLGLSCRRSPATNELVGFDWPEVPLAATLDALLGFGPAAVCVMHSPIDAIEPAIELVGTRWSGPVGAYPELPYPEDPDLARTLDAPAAFESTGPDPFAELAAGWIEAGATIVGGCCGTAPSHIAALRARIDRHPTPIRAAESD